MNTELLSGPAARDPLADIRVAIHLVRRGGRFGVIARAHHPQGPNAESDPQPTEAAARAEALERLARLLAEPRSEPVPS